MRSAAGSPAASFPRGARADRPEGTGAAGPVDCRGALPSRGPFPVCRAPGECAAGAGSSRGRYQTAGGGFVFLPCSPTRLFI